MFSTAKIALAATHAFGAASRGRTISNAVTAETLNDAMLSMLETRIVCHEGRVVDAMALYESMSITPDTFLSAQRK